jgi:hypothetical protein
LVVIIGSCSPRAQLLGSFAAAKASARMRASIGQKVLPDISFKAASDTALN